MNRFSFLEFNYNDSIVIKKLLIYQSTKITVLYFKLPYVQLQKSRNNGHSVDYALQEDAY